MPLSLKLALLGVLLSCAIISGQGPLVTPVGPFGPHLPQIGVGRFTEGAQSMIHGIVVDSNDSPLPNVTVQLRNLQTTKVEQVSTANEVGEFTFVALPDIPYVVEIANQSGQIIAVGDVITTQAGEVAGAIVAIPTRLPVLSGVFGETASSVISAATGTGLTAADATSGPFLSPER